MLFSCHNPQGILLRATAFNVVEGVMLRWSNVPLDAGLPPVISLMSVLSSTNTEPQANQLHVRLFRCFLRCHGIYLLNLLDANLP